MTRFQPRGNLIPLCFIGIVIFVVVFTAGVEKKAERKIIKRRINSSPASKPYGSYSTYCASATPSIQPPECTSTDDPLASGNCTCAPSACPAGATLRMCTSADLNITECTIFSCICNGSSATPNYCVNVLPYPEIAEVPYTPTPGGLVMGLGFGDHDGDFLAMIFHELKNSSLSSFTNNDEKIMQAIANVHAYQQNIGSNSPTSKNLKVLAIIKLAQLNQIN